MLKACSGHPVIPEVYAYGRINHFGLLSMELLHQSLGDLAEDSGPLSIVVVLQVTD